MRGTGIDYSDLHDPNGEYTMRDLSADSMGVTARRGGGRDVEITDVQTTMGDGNLPWTLVRIYTDAGIVGTGEVYWGVGVPELIERMKPFVVVEDLGYGALKFDLDVPFMKDRANRHLRPGEIRHKVDIVQQVTERVRDRADVTFDCHWSFSAGSATRLADAIEAYDVWWLEDPIPPDMPKVGGMRETRKIANVADQYYVPVAMHNVSSPVATMASAHVGTSIPNTLAVEYHSYELGWWEDLVEETVIEDGYIEIPEEPGLGVTLDIAGGVWTGF